MENHKLDTYLISPKHSNRSLESWNMERANMEETLGKKEGDQKSSTSMLALGIWFRIVTIKEWMRSQAVSTSRTLSRIYSNWWS